MSKLNSNHLYQLIKSLNGPEKRYFKRYHRIVSRDSDTLMLRLFELIDKAPSYNEETILKAEKRIKPQVLSSMKTNLYEQLLKSLDNYHDSISLTTKVNRYLRQFEILQKKGLHQQSLKIIQKAEKIALKYELLHLLIPIYHHYYQLDVPGKTIGKASAEYREKVNSTLEKINITTKYQMLLNEVFSLYIEKGYPRNTNDSRFYQKLLAHPLLKEPFTEISFIAKIDNLRIHEVLYELSGNHEASIKNKSKIIMLFEQNPHQIKHWFGTYISSLQNLSVGYLHDKKYNESLKVVERIKRLEEDYSFIKKSADYKARIFAFSFNTILSINILTGKFEACRQLMVGFDTQTQDPLYDSVNNFEKTQILYNMALAYFGLNDFRQAIRYLNEVLKMNKYIRGDLMVMVGLLNVVIHYESGNFGQVEHATRSVYRLLLKRETPYEMEKAIIRFIRADKIYNQDKKTRLQSFSKLKDELESIENKNPFESRFLDTFEIISWLESKIEEKSFATVIHEKAK